MFNVRRSDSTSTVIRKYVQREISRTQRSANVGRIVRGSAGGGSASPTSTGSPTVTANFLFNLNDGTQLSATTMRAEGGPVLEQDTTSTQVILRYEPVNDPMFWLLG